VKNRIASGFNKLSPIYDWLAKTILGKNIGQSQLEMLGQLSNCKHILILGGGTGWILKHIRFHCPLAILDFIDLSPSMVARARKRLPEDHSINFIVGTIENISTKKYDGVITNFYLDMFSEASLEKMIDQILNVLMPRSSWLVVDFVNKTRRQSILLWIMYCFFRFVTAIEARKLPSWQNQLIGNKEIKFSNGKEYSNGFIKANVYTVNKVV
jgi:tRNA (cmo5U34)-methyltransferase